MQPSDPISRVRHGGHATPIADMPKRIDVGPSDLKIEVVLRALAGFR